MAGSLGNLLPPSIKPSRSIQSSQVHRTLLKAGISV